jgi:uncharacterized YccA/Bax inhibitor family protein
MNEVKEFFNNWGKAFAVCYPMMVQGDLSALAFDHFWKANITGFLAAVIATLCTFVWFNDLYRFKWFNPLLLGLSAIVADLLSHPSHFGGFLGEALATGLGTFILASLFVYKPWNNFK